MKTTMIVTTNALTVNRMNVIARRTGSELMAGAKSIMIENLKKELRNGVAHFIYKKKSGVLREAWGTTNRTLAEKKTCGYGMSREHYSTSAYFDVEVGEWRSFRWENIVAVL